MGQTPNGIYWSKQYGKEPVALHYKNKRNYLCNLEIESRINMIYMLKEHLSKLKEYVDKSRNFNLDEWSSYDIENFVNLADQVVKERSTEEGAWELLFLAKTIQAIEFVKTQNC